MVSARLEYRMEWSERCSGHLIKASPHLPPEVITHNAWAGLHTPETGVAAAATAAGGGIGKARGPGRGVRHAGGSCCW